MSFRTLVFALAVLPLSATWLSTSFASSPAGAPSAALPPVSTACEAPPTTTGALVVVPKGVGDKGEDAIVLSVTPAGAGVTATLQDVRNALGAADRNLLSEDSSTHVWTLTRSLLVGHNVTLRVTGGTAGASEGARVDWLRMRSNPGSGSGYDYNAFVSLRARDATLLLSGTKITSWDTAANTYDTNYDDGRAYVLAKGEARMSIAASELSYLGSADGESYGASWRDNEVSSDGKPRTCATGTVTNSTFAHNYYGVYTFQAADMQFVGNAFRDNVQYGFDPHDFTHDVLVQNNTAEGNGSHGFIISRGCFKFTFRDNISRNNKIKPGSKNPSAHGFMLDPGSPSASTPQSPAVSNMYENNQAYGNDGYGFRILGANDNTIQNNAFYSNRLGITLESGSSGNQIVGNQILSSTGIFSGSVLSQGYGISLNGGSDGNTLSGNAVRANRNAGIYVRVGSTQIKNNTVENNGADGIAALPENSASAQLAEGPADDYALPRRAAAAPAPAATTPPNGNQITGNTVRANAGNGLTLKGAVGTVVKNNTFSGNGSDGASLSAITLGGATAPTSTTDTLVEDNTLSGNAIYGIEVYGGAGVTRNTLTRNRVTGNGNNGISVRSGANNGITPPGQLALVGNALRGVTRANAKVEVFSDAGGQAATYEGTTTADNTGFFSFAFASAPTGAYLTATATDGANTSGLSAPLAAAGAPAPQPTNTPAPEPTEAPPDPTNVPAPEPTDVPDVTPRPRVLLPLVAR